MALSAFGGHPILPVTPLNESRAVAALPSPSTTINKTTEVEPGVGARLIELGITEYEQVVALSSIKPVGNLLKESLQVGDEGWSTFLQFAKKVVGPSSVKQLTSPLEVQFGLGAQEPTHKTVYEPNVVTANLLTEEVSNLPIATSVISSVEHFENSLAALSDFGSSINYLGEMPPVKDQGERGTCVAFAVTAINEFYFKQQYGVADDLSEQHLYFEAKQLDNIPHTCGTFIKSAVQALHETGQCLERTWSYNPLGTCNAHGVLPARAREFAGRYRNPRIFSLGKVDELKTALARGSVVAFSVPVFESWFLSQEVKRTGRITMPIPGEKPNGGHAMCLVGFQDDASVPGGGFFIVRNSWNTFWASHSPYGPGNGIIPYAYLQNHLWEAFAIL